MHKSKLLKVVDNDGRVTAAGLHEDAVRFANDQFNEHKTINHPVFVIPRKESTGYIEVGWDTEEGKLVAMAGIASILSATNAHCYSMIMEAKMAVLNVEQMVEWKGLRPSELPEHVTDDVMTIWTFTVDDFIDTKYLVNLRPNGQHYLGIRVDDDIKSLDQPKKHSGALMWNLLAILRSMEHDEKLRRAKSRHPGTPTH